MTLGSRSVRLRPQYWGLRVDVSPAQRAVAETGEVTAEECVRAGSMQQSPPPERAKCSSSGQVPLPFRQQMGHRRSMASSQPCSQPPAENPGAPSTQEEISCPLVQGLPPASGNRMLKEPASAMVLGLEGRQGARAQVEGWPESGPVGSIQWCAGASSHRFTRTGC